MQTRKQSAKPGRRRIALFLLLFLMLSGAGVYLYLRISEVGPGSLFGWKHIYKSSFRLADQPVYQVKKRQELMGVQVTRIISHRQPEEFLVVDGVSRRLVDRLYGTEPNLAWAGLMANQLLRLRQGGPDAGTPVSLEIQRVRTIGRGTIHQDHETFPYWQIEVKFRLSNESEPRYYNAGIVRDIRGKQDIRNTHMETLLIGYAQRGAFQKDLLPDLLSHIHFDIR